MKRFIKLLLPLAVIATVVAIVGPGIFKPNRVAAVGDLLIDFHVPEGDPIFIVENMLPGDFQERNIDITNGGTIVRMVKMRAVRTGGVGADPKLESILDIVIKDGITPIYGTGSLTGSKTVEQFFADFANIDGTSLGTINPAEHKTYNFGVTFPPESGNEFQLKSVIFDLIFGDGTEPTPTPTNTPTPTPTPSGNLCGNISIDINGNGAGSVNGVFIICKNFKVVTQINNTFVNTYINSTANTGGNTSTGNTNSSSSVVSGASTSKSGAVIKGSRNKNR